MKTQPKVKPTRVNDEKGKFVVRNLMKTDPKKEQFAPTEKEPVPQLYRMGGGC